MRDAADMLIENFRRDIGSVTSRAATIVAQFDPWSDEKGFRAVGLHLGVQFETGDTEQGFVDLRHFPDESETSANLYDVMLDMLGKCRHSTSWLRPHRPLGSLWRQTAGPMSITQR